MNQTARYLTLVFTLFALTVMSHAQDLSLEGRSGLQINLGFWGGATTSNSLSISGVRSEAKTSGFAGGLLFKHWMQENLSVTLSAGLLGMQGSTAIGPSGLDIHASDAIPVLLGVQYYLPSPGPGDAIRPFLSAAVGPIIGFEAKVTGISQSAVTETTFGGRVGGGIDFFMGPHVALTADMGYNLMADFDTSIGSKKNFNGAQFSLGLGYIF